MPLILGNNSGEVGMEEKALPLLNTINTPYSSYIGSLFDSSVSLFDVNNNTGVVSILGAVCKSLSGTAPSFFMLKHANIKIFLLDLSLY